MENTEGGVMSETQQTPEAINPDAWAEAAATKTLDLAEMEALVVQYNEKWTEYEALQDVANAKKAEFTAIEATLLQALKDAGKKNYLSKLGTVYVIQKVTVSLPKGLTAKREFMSYLKSFGDDVYDGMVSINSATLNSWYNQRLEEETSKGNIGFKVPGVEEPTTRESLGFRSKKGGSLK